MLPTKSLAASAGLAFLSVAALVADGSRSFAQPLPNRPIVITSPYAGGGSTDFSLRTIARKMEELEKVTVVIESRPGGAGTVAALAVKAGAADGTSLMLADVGTFASNVLVGARSKSSIEMSLS